MEATNEEILSLPPGQTKSSLKATRKALVLTYHPDRMNEFDELERLIFNRRMAEINNAYDELRVKQGQ
jgi:curved DNA-binding protein CbpA